MDKDDENYPMMSEKKDTYMKDVLSNAIRGEIPMSQWEVEEIEMAFEHGFVQGFISGNTHRKNGNLH